MSSLGFLNRKKSTIVFLCSIVSVVIFVLSEGEILEGIDDLDFAIGSDDSADRKKTSGFENH